MVFGKTDKSMEKEKLVSGSGKTKVILLVVKDIDMYTNSTVGHAGTAAAQTNQRWFYMWYMFKT